MLSVPFYRHCACVLMSERLQGHWLLVKMRTHRQSALPLHGNFWRKMGEARLTSKVTSPAFRNRRRCTMFLWLACRDGLLLGSMRC